MVKGPVNIDPSVKSRIDDYIASVGARLDDDDPADVVQETLAGIHGDGDLFLRWKDGESIPTIDQIRLESYHPRNAIIKGDHWAEKDQSRFERAKPIRWLWAGFDASPLANDLAIALPFRQMLAERLFAKAGKQLQLFRGIRFPYGYNIEMGDRVVVHEDVLLDDRGELAIGDRVSIADRAAIHSHGHDIVDQTDVSIFRTIIKADARIASEAMIGAGCRVGTNAMVGAKAVVRGDVPAHHVAVGAPARGVKVKPGWASTAGSPGRLEDNRAARRIEYELSDDFERVDEFQRRLVPTDESEV